jgi:hypothetical protein
MRVSQRIISTIGFVFKLFLFGIFMYKVKTEEKTGRKELTYTAKGQTFVGAGMEEQN